MTPQPARECGTVICGEFGAHTVTLNDDNVNTSDAGEAPKKPARRRVTRATSSPVAAPVQFLTAEQPAATAPKTTVGNATVVSSPATEQPTATAPRRSRRATSTGRAAGASVAVSGTASEIAQQAGAANERNQAAEKSAEKAPAKGSSTRSRSARKPAQISDEAPATSATSRDADAGSEKGAAKKAQSEKAQSEKAQSEKVQSGKAGAGKGKASGKNSGKNGAKKTKSANTETAVAAATESGNPGSGTTESAQVESDATKTETKTAKRSAGTQDGGEKQAESSQSTGATSSRSERTTRTRSRGRGQVFSDGSGAPVEQQPVAAPARPRLATTALLFQAPDLTATPEPVVDEAEETEEVEEAVAEVAPQATRRNRNQRRRGANSASEGEKNDDTQTLEQAVGNTEDDQENAQDDSAEDESNEQNDESEDSPRRRRRRGGRGRRNRNASDTDESDSDALDNDDSADTDAADSDAGENADAGDVDDSDDDEYSSSRRRRRRRRSGRSGDDRSGRTASDEVTALKGSTRLEAKRQRRREGRDAGRRRTIITEAEFLARRESVERSMVVREQGGRTQIAVLEDGVLVEHYVSQQSSVSMAGNVYLGRVQNVLPSMEAAFVDIGKGRNAVLYAGEVNWDVHGIDGQPRRIEEALKSGDSVLVQVTKDPIGHKGARLTSQVTLAGRYLVYVPGGGMTGISRKLPDVERTRLKRILKEVVPEGAGVIVRTAAEGASEDELKADIARLRTQWEKIEKKSKTANAPALLQGEPDLAIRVVRDIFNDDFNSLKVQGDNAWNEISSYVSELAPDLADRVSKWVDVKDIFSSARVDEQLAKGMDRKVWLPSGGSLVIDRTEAMTVIDVNTGKFTGQGGTLEETVTRNNLEAAEEIVRQLRLRDIGGIIVIDFIDMVLESNRDLVLRRLVECLGRDRTKHQVAEVTSLGLVQMTRKRVGQGLVEAFSTTCEHCNGRGFIVHEEPNEKQGNHVHNNSPEQKSTASEPEQGGSKRSRRKRGSGKDSSGESGSSSAGASASGTAHADAGAEVSDEAREAVKATLATIAAAAASAHEAEAHAAESQATESQLAESQPTESAVAGEAGAQDDASAQTEASAQADTTDE